MEENTCHLGGFITEKIGDLLVFAGGVGISLIVIIFLSQLLNIGMLAMSVLLIVPGLILGVVGYRVAGKHKENK
jgi:hypothetical protein